MHRLKPLIEMSFAFNSIDSNKFTFIIDLLLLDLPLLALVIIDMPLKDLLLIYLYLIYLIYLIYLLVIDL